jgi:hypothetical protein
LPTKGIAPFVSRLIAHQPRGDGHLLNISQQSSAVAAASAPGRRSDWTLGGQEA